MSNQENSPKTPSSSGFTTLDDTWQRLLEVNKQAGTCPPLYLQAMMKYAYMQGATASYNRLVESIRADSTLSVFVNVSQQIMTEINEYFETALQTAAAAAQAPSQPQH